MKTLTKGILGTVIAVACVYCGYATYDSYIYQQENALLLANVEALGQNESGPLGPSECPGPEIYSISGVIDAQLSSKTHKNDSTDVVTVYACKKCVATGSGSLQGNNSLYFDFRYEKERNRVTVNIIIYHHFNKDENEFKQNIGNHYHGTYICFMHTI